MKKLEYCIKEFFVTEADKIYSDYNNNKLPKTLLYHYTNRSGLEGILKNKVIWFKNFINLTDKDEIHYSIDIVTDAISQYLKKSPSKFFGEIFQEYTLNTKNKILFTPIHRAKPSIIKLLGKSMGIKEKDMLLVFANHIFNPMKKG